MESKLEKALVLADRLIMHIESGVSPEVEIIRELKKLIPEIREEHGISRPINKSICGTA